MDYRIAKTGDCSGGECYHDPSTDKDTVSLQEKRGNGSWQSGGKTQSGGFEDTLSPETRTLTQQWSVDNQRVQVVLGWDSNSNPITTWDVHVDIEYPHPPAYSPAPEQ